VAAVKRTNLDGLDEAMTTRGFARPGALPDGGWGDRPLDTEARRNYDPLRFVFLFLDGGAR
jgi:hypothetical protein